MIRSIGLDVHRQSVRACCCDPGGQILWEKDLAATLPALQTFAQKHLSGEDQLALEATFHSHAIADLLRPFVGRVVLSNPVQTKAIAQAKIKTDKVDARVLSHLLRCDYLPEVWQPDADTQRLRSLTHRRAGLIGQRTGVKNRLHSVLAQRLIAVEVSDLFGAKGRTWLASVPLDAQGRGFVESDLRLLDALDTEIAALDALLAQAAWADERAKLLMTLLGVDYPVAMTLLAALGDVTRFESGAQLASYLGLVPSTHQSGEHCYHGPITKRGNGKARWMLIQAAQHADTHPGPLGVFFRRLAKKKNRNVAVVATARKMAVIAWHMLRQNEPYRYAQPAPTQGKLARLRVKASGQRRKTGPAKGQAPSVHYGTGTRVRRVPSLPTVLAEEGLPPTAPLAPGEHKALEAMQVEEYVASLQQPTERPRRPEAQRAPGAQAKRAQASSLIEEEEAPASPTPAPAPEQTAPASPPSAMPTPTGIMLPGAGMDPVGAPRSPSAATGTQSGSEDGVRQSRRTNPNETRPSLPGRGARIRLRVPTRGGGAADEENEKRRPKIVLRA